MDQATANQALKDQYTTLARKLDVIRNMIDTADGDFHRLTVEILDRRLREKVYAAHEVIVLLNAKSSGARLPPWPY